MILFLSWSFLIIFLLVNYWRLLSEGPKHEAQLDNSSKFLIISIPYDKLNYRNSFIPFVPRDKFKVWIDSYEISVIHTYYTLHIFYISGLLLLPSGVLNLYWIISRLYQGKLCWKHLWNWTRIPDKISNDIHHLVLYCRHINLNSPWPIS